MKKLLLLLATTATMQATAQVDTTNGFEAPADVSKDVQELATYLTEGLSSDKEKANVLFNWVTHNISYDVKAAKDPEYKYEDANEVLKSRDGISNDYAELYKDLCLAAGVDAVTIHGYHKDWKYDSGDEIYMPDYTWCAVKLSNKWEIVDPTRGAGVVTYTPGWVRKQLNKLTKEKVYYAKTGTFEFDYKPDCFMMDPLIARFKRVPMDPVWQMTEEVMPMFVFRQGDSNIMAYNQANYYRVDNQPAMQKCVGMSDAERVLETAKRVFEYNKRYEAILGSRDYIEAGVLAEGYVKEGNLKIAQNMAIVARNKLDSARVHYKEQEKSISPHYNTLKRKNGDKNRLASKRIREIKVDDKLLQSKYSSRKSAAERKLSGIDEKREEAEKEREEIKPGAINEVETMSIEKEPGDPMLDAVGDSIDAKETRARALAGEIEEEAASIRSLQSENEGRLKDIMKKMELADSFFVLEADARMRLMDSYDKRVKDMMEQYDKYNKEAEILHLQYLDMFDSITERTDKMHREYMQLTRLYKGILRHLEQYQRWYSREPNVKPEYAKVIENYIQAIDNYLQSQGYYETYLTSNLEYFKALEKAYEGKQDIIEYMEKGEETRKEMEDEELEEAKVYDERKIAIALNQVDELEVQIEEAISDLEKAEAKRLEEQLKLKEEMEKKREKETKKKK